jgi:NAD(P)-dependent dehydrogenase (short-subunit alcohol dehydrogenase family)
MKKKLEGRTAIVTGASQGLGKEICRAYVENGARVVICARDEDSLAQTSLEIRAGLSKAGCATYAQECVAYRKADVSDAAQVASLVDFAIERFGKVDILVNNAGIYGPKGLIEDVDWDEWVRAMEINLYGPILMIRSLMKHFRSFNYGKIINLSGGGATAPLPRLSAYAASKAAIVRLTETIAHEAAGTGIDINAVAPGALNTRLLDEILEAGPQAVGQQFYERSLKQKEDGGASMERAADLCVYLGSAQSDGISGRLLSALWDPWAQLPQYKEELAKSEVYTLRRIVPADRGLNWE